MGCPTNTSFPSFAPSVSVAKIFQAQSKCLVAKEENTLFEHFIQTLPLQEEIVNPSCPTPSPCWGHAGLGKHFWGATVGPVAVSGVRRGQDTQARCPQAEPGSAPHCESPSLCGGAFASLICPARLRMWEHCWKTALAS